MWLGNLAPGQSIERLVVAFQWVGVRGGLYYR